MKALTDEEEQLTKVAASAAALDRKRVRARESSSATLYFQMLSGTNP